MPAKEDLKGIVILGHLTDVMLDKLLPFIEQEQFSEGDRIFREGDVSKRFYMLKSGKIILEQNISGDMHVAVTAIKPGYSFGWSAMLSGEGAYTLTAVCKEACEVFSIKREAIRRLLDEDHSMGYFLMQRILVVVKKRLDRRTEQFMRLLIAHPDIRTLSDTDN